MADRMSAEIWIGGDFPRRLLIEFPVIGLAKDWDNDSIVSTNETDVLAAKDENGFVHFADVEAAWGEFRELEAWLRQHRIPFRRRSEGKYEHAPELVEFRPDLKGKRNRNVSVMTSPEGAPVIRVSDVGDIIDRMATLSDDRQRSVAKLLQAWRHLFDKLLRALPPKLPPIPPFQIVDK